VRHVHLRQSREGGAPPRAHEDELTVRLLEHNEGLHLGRVVEVVRTYLTLDDVAALRPAGAVAQDVRIVRHAPCPVAEYRRLYNEVGEPWFWHDRLEWSDAELAEHLAKPVVAVRELMVGDESAGYYELQCQDDGSVEIVYFGLTPAFIGRGLGGMLLTEAVREAFAMGATRVWLHTCTLDSPNALPAYEARGFRPYRTQRLEVEIEGSQVISEQLLD
jgi:GNAT superfamily N-acetyltransferase